MPEHKFPAAVEDAYESYLWARKNADVLEIDPEKIVVAGDSAAKALEKDGHFEIEKRIDGDDHITLIQYFTFVFQPYHYVPNTYPERTHNINRQEMGDEKIKETR